MLSGWPEYLEPLREDAPEGWVVTAYPWYSIKTPEHDRFMHAYQRRWGDHPRLGSVIGYASLRSIATAIKKAGSTDTESALQIRCSPHEHLLSGLNLACEIP